MSELDTEHPCVRHSCHLCCIDTEMTLSASDVRRIGGLGYRDYYREVDGYIQLRNRDGHCWFLEGGRCTIYDHRPEGCTLYPLVLNLDDGTVVLHDFCPHREEFRFSRRQKDQLGRLVQKQERERDIREDRTR